MCTASTDNDCICICARTHTHTSTLCHWAGTSLKDWKQLKLSSAVALGRPVAARGELPLCISLSVSAMHRDMRGSVTARSLPNTQALLPLLMWCAHTCALVHGLVTHLPLKLDPDRSHVHKSFINVVWAVFYLFVVTDEVQVNTWTRERAISRSMDYFFLNFTCVYLHTNPSSINNNILSSGPERKELLRLRDGKKEEKFREVCARCLRCTC